VVHVDGLRPWIVGGGAGQCRSSAVDLLLALVLTVWCGVPLPSGGAIASGGGGGRGGGGPCGPDAPPPPPSMLP
jgi:hypothetical protein